MKTFVQQTIWFTLCVSVDWMKSIYNVYYILFNSCRFADSLIYAIQTDNYAYKINVYFGVMHIIFFSKNDFNQETGQLKVIVICCMQLFCKMIPYRQKFTTLFTNDH